VEEISGVCGKLPSVDVYPQEKISEFAFPELEGLIEKHTSVKAVAELLDVSYQTVLRWRTGKNKPNDKMLEKIKRESKKVRLNDTGRTDNPDSSRG
jgi:transcriptional regulator with XRE-family HTH domain